MIFTAYFDTGFKQRVVVYYLEFWTWNNLLNQSVNVKVQLDILVILTLIAWSLAIIEGNCKKIQKESLRENVDLVSVVTVDLVSVVTLTVFDGCDLSFIFWNDSPVK